jgi:hypothetical protein|tara:strand:+ start:4306 stop:4572 length:267 start_codon:yes stop_codon:yes gene_type:complete
MQNYEVCIDCGCNLRKVRNLRVKPTKCHDCRNHSRNYELKRIFEETAKASKPEEGMFEDITHRDPDEGVIHKQKPSNQIGVRSSLGTL